MMRLFIGWRITESLESIHTNSYLENVLQKQGSPLLPSVQKPPLYASDHSSFFQKKAFMINPIQPQGQILRNGLLLLTI